MMTFSINSIFGNRLRNSSQMFSLSSTLRYSTPFLGLRFPQTVSVEITPQALISESHYNDLKNKHPKKKGLPCVREAFLFSMAEREGFEPSVELSPHTRLAGERLQPARPSLLDADKSAYH